ncbi:hypothetical protein Moror_16219 [Moniliophthora roreri MCA 2997]|uniref:F-box domain-containing protein n=1 Tax=Moniliophthora roreri (strain MCA 2997) TaxID=1381753 RepID=V2X992_MONRO|nr:hypothetical protein Moror_16219 [Moniliophthora roreri MCA 2997]
MDEITPSPTADSYGSCERRTTALQACLDDRYDDIPRIGERLHCQCFIEPLCQCFEAAFAALSSPAAHLLNSNRIPSPQEIIQIYDTLNDIQRASIQLETKIRSLESALKEFRNKQDELQSFAQEHKALLSPARRMLPELWSEIFIHCLPEHSLDYHINRRNVSCSDAPLLLTQVCSTWRTIAISTPQLWSNITYTVCRPSAMKIQLRRLETWLARTGAAPLSVVVFRSFFDANNNVLDHPHLTFPDPIPPLNEDQVMNFILAHSHRWRRAEILLPALEAAQVVAPLRGNLPNLEKLAFGLFWDGMTAMGDPHGRLDVFETAPKLQEVCFVENARLQVSLPGSSLTTLSVDAFLSCTDALKTLYYYPNLRNCALNVMLTVSAPPNLEKLIGSSSGGLIRLQLQSLTLSFTGSTDFVYPNFLAYLDIPNITELRIRSHKWCHDQLFAFFTQLPQSALVETLELSSPSLSPVWLRAYLLSPVFRHLRILVVGKGITHHVPFIPNDAALQSLFTSKGFLPGLEMVQWTCFGQGTEQYDSTVLYDMLRARLDGGRGLRRFVLTLNRKWGDELSPKRPSFGSDGLASLGLQVEIKTGQY